MKVWKRDEEPVAQEVVAMALEAQVAVAVVVKKETVVVVMG